MAGNTTETVRYVGKKAFTVDSVCRTGITWDGPGSVRQVPKWAAKKLYNYPDQWQPADASQAPGEIEKALAEVHRREAGRRNKDPKDMTRTELVEYIVREHGEEWRERGEKCTREELLASIEERETNQRLDGEFEQHKEVGSPI